MSSTVILGGGIIGLSTAYYLAEHQPGSTIHLVDSSPRLFASASGLAGGYVAKDWFRPSCAALGALSFREHGRLAGLFDGARKWGYAPSVTVSFEPGTAGSRPRGNGAGGGGGAGHDAADDWLVGGRSRAEVVREREEAVKRGDVPHWLRRVDGDEVSVLDNGGGTAIVNPLKLCHFLLERCKSLGVQVHYPATALGITTDVRNELASVRIGYTDSSTETEIPCTRLLLSAGAWTPGVFAALFPESTLGIPVSSLSGHSLVLKTPGHAELKAGLQGEEEEEVRCHSVYCELEDLAPEVFARREGVIFLAGVNSTDIPLPTVATDAHPEEASTKRLLEIAHQLIAATTEGQALEVVRTSLCFRPITARGTPILDRIRDEHLGGGVTTRRGSEGGVFVAAGHGPWGISLSLGTGKVMAEMMQGRDRSADVSRLGL